MDPPVFIRINWEYVRTQEKMKYLGVMLDSRLKFTQHFRFIGEKMAKVTHALGRLMPNTRGPDELKRRLTRT